MTDWLNRCHFGDCLQVLQRMPDGIVNTCVTSPPYFGLRDYGHAGQIGLEPTPDEFIAKLVSVFREVRRVLREDGTLWVNMGDSYGRGARIDNVNDGKRGATGNTGHVSMTAAKAYAQGGEGREHLPAKNLIGIPWKLAFALQADGWILRQDIIWAKPNPMPESVTDRCTKSHEYIFLLSKSPSYYCDMGAIKEQAVGANEHDLTGRTKQRGMGDTFKRTDSKRAAPIHGQAAGTHREDRAESEYPLDSRNKRSVWTVSTKPYKGAHFATFPTDLIEPCILAGAPAGGVVLDPFFGSGTTGQVSQALGRKFIGIELNADYKTLQDQRLQQPSLDLEAA